mmetsp:Transcript_19063/g.30460  ORF Transcript_19063/g.30460 Transcript_19063/m.30460 type:complete len:328 (+) Transcript_19063:1672-2655(+)
MIAVGDGPLDSWVEANKLGLLVLSDALLSLCCTEVINAGGNDGLVNRILFVGWIRRHACPYKSIIARDFVSCPRPARKHPHVCRRQSPCLVGAQHGHGCNLLQCSHVRHDGLPFCHAGSTNSHGHLHHQRQCDGNCADDQRQDPQKRLGERDMAVVHIHVENYCCVHQRHKDHCTDHLHDLRLKDASLMPRGLSDKAGSLTDLRVQSSLLHLAVTFTLLDDASRQQGFAGPRSLAFAIRAGHLPRQGLPCERCSVHQHLVSFNEFAVRRHHIATAEEDDISRHKFSYRHNDHGAVPLHGDSRGHLRLQSIQRLPRFVLLVETNESVH